MTDYGGKTGEILHELSRFVAFSCRFRRCSDHRIARHGKVRTVSTKADEDSDYENDYIFDTTIVCDMSSKPWALFIAQYGGTEEQMGSDRDDTSLFAIYEVDTSSHTVEVYMCQRARSCPHYTDFHNQALHNANKSSSFGMLEPHPSFITKVKNLLARVEKNDMYDDMSPSSSLS